MPDTNCNHPIPDPSCEVCGLHQLARNHYFDGKFMATRQFQVEQDYVRGANQRQNAYMHGVGTVCGLKIAEHENPDCRNQYVVLKEGLAIDCCGREIVVPTDKVLDIRTRVQEKLNGMGANPPDLTTPDREAYTLRILLAYRQRGAEAVPALLDDCDDGSGEECDQIVESFGWDVTLDREAPPAEGDPLEPSLQWRQTLTVARPAAAVADRDSDRLYVAEMSADGGAVRAYNTETHDLLAYALVYDAPDQAISAVALSRNGETLYVAVGLGDDQPGRIILVDRANLEAMALPNVAAEPLPFIELAAGQRVVGLAAAARDDALLALAANSADGLDATLRRWSADEIVAFLAAWDPANPGANQPVAADRDLTALLRTVKNDPALPEIRPVDMVQDIDGRWLVVADAADAGSGAGRLVALSLAGFNTAEASPQNFINAFGLGAGRAPRSVDLSYDGNYAYAVVSDGAAPPATSLLRLKTDPTDLGAYLPEGLPLNDRIRELPLVLAGEAAGGPDAIDAVVTPRDNFAYVLRRAAGPGFGGDLLIADVEQVEQMGPGLIADRAAWLADPNNQERLEKALRAGPVVQGAVDFQTLAPLGQRLYVATHREPPPPEEGEEPELIFDGRVRVYDIDEASCDAALRAIIEACPTCGTTQPLVLATISHYWYDQPMVENEPPGDEPFNLIDNFTERPLAPSNVVLREVIECLIAKGIAEGIPGPRGPQGEQGQQGPPGNDGVGLPGPRGPGVVEVRLEEGPPDAELELIPNDPEGDFTLVLTLPTVGAAPANHVSGANFLHEEIFDRGLFNERFINQSGDERLHGFLIGFEQPVRAGTLTNRTAYALVHLRGQGVSPVSLLPMMAIPVRFDPEDNGVDMELLDGYRIVGEDGVVLLLNVPPENTLFDPDEEANGVLLVPFLDGTMIGLDTFFGFITNMAEPELFPRDLDPGSAELPVLCQVTVVLRGDQIMTPDGLFLDGNNLSGRPMMGLPSGNGTPGGDWVAVMHLQMGEPG